MTIRNMTLRTDELSSMAQQLQQRVAQFKIRNGSSGACSRQEGPEAAIVKAAARVLPRSGAAT
jgi:hypothetical protein